MTPEQMPTATQVPAHETSIGGERISMTMQAEFDHHTLDQAIAAGLLDMPDEAGMVRIPITIFVTIPGEVLQPPNAPKPA